MSCVSTVSCILRTILMLALLVAIPLLALCGPGLPQVFMQTLEKRFPILAQAGAASPEPAAEQSHVEPQFEPCRAETFALPRGKTEVLPQDPPANDVAQSFVAERSRGVIPTAFDAPADAAGGAPTGNLAVGLSDPFAASSANFADGRRAMPPDEPTDLRTLSGRNTMPTTAADAAADATANATAAAMAGAHRDQFAQLQNRFREMGATYFVLESWGTQQQLCRFYCKMAVGGNPNCTRHFEATDADPLTAMTLVLKQVETWLAGQI